MTVAGGLRCSPQGDQARRGSRSARRNAHESQACVAPAEWDGPGSAKGSPLPSGFRDAAFGAASSKPRGPARRAVLDVDPASAGRFNPLFLYTSDLSRRFSYHCSVFLIFDIFLPQPPLSPPQPPLSPPQPPDLSPCCLTSGVRADTFAVPGLPRGHGGMPGLILLFELPRRIRPLFTASSRRVVVHANG